MMFYYGVRAQKRLADVTGGKLIFSIDEGISRSFIRFDNLEQFESWYAIVPARRRTVSEVITCNMRKLIIDIDNPDISTFEKLSMYDFEKHVVSRIHDVFFSLDIGVPDVAFYSICSRNVISYHAVVVNFAFTATTCAGLCAIISHCQPWKGCADMGVYKRTQFIRLEGSTKFGEHRWKRCTNRHRRIEDGMLSQTSKACVSNLTCTILSRAKQLKCESLHMYDRQSFKVGKQNGRMITLIRTKPSMCFQCGRVHDRENAALLLSSCMPPRFLCWRYR